MSPTAYKPFISVWQFLSTLIKPASLVILRCDTNSEDGKKPIYSNNPSTFSSRPDFNVNFSSASPPSILAISSSKTNSIFLILLIFSTKISSARNCLRRWIKYTLFTIPDKYKLSPTAEFPPPTTATSLPLYKFPSQIAHQETPLPSYFSSPGTSNFRCFIPVEIITVLASSFLPLFKPTSKPSGVLSTDVANSLMYSAPNLVACMYIFIERSAPGISSNPG